MLKIEGKMSKDKSKDKEDKIIITFIRDGKIYREIFLCNCELYYKHPKSVPMLFPELHLMRKRYPIFSVFHHYIIQDDGQLKISENEELTKASILVCKTCGKSSTDMLLKFKYKI